MQHNRALLSAAPWAGGGWAATGPCVPMVATWRGGGGEKGRRSRGRFAPGFGTMSQVKSSYYPSQQFKPPPTPALTRMSSFLFCICLSRVESTTNQCRMNSRSRSSRGLRPANDISQARSSGSSLSLSNFPEFSDSHKSQLIGLETFTWAQPPIGGVDDIRRVPDQWHQGPESPRLRRWPLWWSEGI